MLSILSKTVSTLSEKKGPDSLQAIESVGSGVMENIGKYVFLLEVVSGQAVADLSRWGDLQIV